MIEGNQPRICGHPKESHSFAEDRYEVLSCKLCIMTWQYAWVTGLPVCTAFKLNNLAYLENLYNEKISANAR